MISALWSRGIPRCQHEDVVLGTLDARTRRRGLSGNVTVDEVAGAMADFKAFMRVDVTPRHRSRSDDATA
jgi:hypothetical protein